VLTLTALLQGPTCLLIQCVEGDAVFGVFSGAAWKESNRYKCRLAYYYHCYITTLRSFRFHALCTSSHFRFYGNSDSFLFTLAPEFKILRVSSTTNGAYQWLNLKVSIYVCICMDVCMHMNVCIFMYVRMYVCMYVCMYVFV
jgi:hypothetical protein